MVKKIFIFALLSLAAFSPPLFSKVPLRQAVVQALERSREIGAQRLNEESAAVRRDEAQARRGFRLDLGGTLGYASDSPHITAGDMPWVVSRLEEDVPSDFHLITTPRVMYDLRLALRHMLYAGGGIRRTIEAEEIGDRAETEMRRVLENKVEAEVLAAYYGFRILQAKRNSIELLGRSLDAHLQKVERLFEAEQVRKTDVLEARLKAEELRASALDLERSIAEEKIRFLDLSGIDPGDVEEPPSADVPVLAEALPLFRTSHPLLQYYETKISQAEALGRAAAGGGLPKIAAVAQLHLGRPGISLFNKTPDFYVLGGLDIEFPLLDAKKRASETAQAGIERRRLENRRDGFVQESERDLRRLYEIKAGLEAKRASAERLEALADEDVRLKTRLYEESQIPNLDCLAALSQLERYRAMKDDLLYEIEAVKARIRGLIGAGKERP